jgi:putative toxin-antitoxin system antitoxin component (TIGR02293 family)
MNHAAKTSAQVPGRVLGIMAESSGELIRQVGRGFSFRALHNLESQTGIPVSQVAELLGIPPRTLARRKASGRLTADESEKLLRISSTFEKTLELFEGDRTRALAWLSSPKRELENRTPLQYSRTEIGAREVENLLGRLEHGIFS